METTKGIHVRMNVNGIDNDMIKKIADITENYRTMVRVALADVDSKDVTFNFDQTTSEWHEIEYDDYAPRRPCRGR